MRGSAMVEAGQGVSGLVELCDQVDRQDLKACQLTQLSMDSRAYREGGILVPNESHVTAFHIWVTEQTLW